MQVNEAFEGCQEGGGRVEAVGTQDIGNAAIEAFDPAIGLGPSGLDQVVFDTVIGADPIEGRQTPVGERSPVGRSDPTHRRCSPCAGSTTASQDEATGVHVGG